MNTNTMELNMDEMEMVNGGSLKESWSESGTPPTAKGKAGIVEFPLHTRLVRLPVYAKAYTMKLPKRVWHREA